MVTTGEIKKKKKRQIETYKMSLIVTNDIINRFKASAETRSLYKCAFNWAETKW